MVNKPSWELEQDGIKQLRRAALRDELYEAARKRGLTQDEAVTWSRAEATRLVSLPEPRPARKAPAKRRKVPHWLGTSMIFDPTLDGGDDAA